MKKAIGLHCHQQIFLPFIYLFNFPPSLTSVDVSWALHNGLHNINWWKWSAGFKNKMADETQTVDEEEKKEGGFTRVSAKNNTRKRFVGTKSLVGKKSDTLAGIFFWLNSEANYLKSCYVYVHDLFMFITSTSITWCNCRVLWYIIQNKAAL